MQWTNVAAESEIREKGGLVSKLEGKQIAILVVGEALYAIDNRCPHEGFPLKKGTVDNKSCVLTCQWHNWKFDLKTGRCLQGEDHVRTYPIQVIEGVLQIDLTDPSPEQLFETIMVGLREGVRKGQYGRIAREVARLVCAGLDPLLAIGETLRAVHDRVEYGTSHAWPACADWLSLFDETSCRERHVTCITESLFHLADDTLREAEYPYCADHVSFSDSAFLAAIEAEDEAGAVALIRGAVAEGLAWCDLEPCFGRAALAHYRNIGHQAIFVIKTGELLRRFGQDLLLPLLLPLTRSLCMSSREDLIPQFKEYAPVLNDCPSQWGDACHVDLPVPFGLGVKDALVWTRNALMSASPEAVFEVLLSQCARNMLFFDSRYEQAFDRPVTHNIDWLDFTHTLTFGNAVRRLSQKEPSLWYPGLLQMACSLGRNKNYLDCEQDVSAFTVLDSDSFFTQQVDNIMDHGIRYPIFACHLLKTCLAVREELPKLSPDNRPIVLAALNRFLQAPLKQRHVRRTVRQALDLVGRDVSSAS